MKASEKLARAADHEGMTVTDLIRFPDLLKKHGVKKTGPTIVRNAQEFLDNWDSRTRNRVRRTQKSQKSEYTDPTFDDSTGEDTTDEVPTTPKPERKTPMAKNRTITLDEARSLLVACGLKTAGRSDAAKLNGKIANLAEYATEEVVGGLEKPLATLAKRVLKALSNGDIVTVKEPETGETTPAKGEKSAGGKEKSEGAAEAAPKKKKTAAARDSFGNRHGTSCHEVNKVIAGMKEGQVFTPTDVHEAAAKQKEMRINFVRDHMRTLTTKKLIQRVKDGWKLAAAGSNYKETA